MSVLTRLPRAKLIVAVLALFMAALCGVAVQGNAAKALDKADLVTIAADQQSKDPTIVINLSTAEMVDIGGAVSDVMLADPAIADVSVIQSSKLYIVGIALGSTNLIALDENGNVLKRLNIHVTMDTTNLQRTMDELFPEEDVKVNAIRGQVILTGSVSTPDVAQSVQNVVGHYMTEIEGRVGNADEVLVNLMTVKGKAQVMLRVKVMEISRNLLRERGAATAINDIGDLLGDDVQVSPTLGVFGAALGAAVSPDAFAAFGLVENIGAFGPIESILSLLEDQGLARIMAEPNLTAISGEQAGFLAGGEFPVPAGSDERGNIVITFRQFGVSLNFAPTVMSENRIVLRFETEVSSLSRDSDVQLQGFDVPGLDVRRASTTVEMPSGTSLMIAGLLQSQTVKNLQGMPGMVNTPIIGDLFSSDSFRREETEMVVLVTPYIVEPFGNKREAEKVSMPEKEASDLAYAFSRNIKRTYGDKRSSSLFDGEPSFGYIID